MRSSTVRALLAASAMVLLSATGGAATADAAVTGLTDCRFSKAQVFDVQWRISGSTLSVSSLTRPYASNEPRSGQLLESEIADTDTFGFYENGSDVGFRQYAADGSLIRTVHLSGTFRATGPDFIFYLGDNSWGTMITSGEGFAYGDSTTLTVDAEYVTPADALDYTTCSATALAVGQTRSEVESDGGGGGDGGGGDPAPTATSGPRVRPDGDLPTAAPCAAAVHDRRTVAPLDPALGDGSLTLPDHGLATAPMTMAVEGPIGRGAEGCARTTVGPLTLRLDGPLPADQVIEVWMLSTPRLVAAHRVVEGEAVVFTVPLDAPLDGGAAVAPGLHVLQVQFTDGVSALTADVSIELVDAPSAGPRPAAVPTGGQPTGPLPLTLAPVVALLAAGLVLHRSARSDARG